MDPVNMAKRVAQYRQVRDALKKMDEDYEAKRKPLVEIQNLLTGAIADHMKANNMTSAKTEAGTATLSTRYTASLADPDAFMQFVRANDMFELLDRRANATAVKEYVRTNQGRTPPGVNLSALESLSVTKPRKKTSDIIAAVESETEAAE